MIQLTEVAKEKLKEIAAAEGLENQFVRVKIQGGGCAGFSYDMGFEPTAKDTDEVIEFDSVKLIVDPISLQYLEDCTIDYIDAMIGAGFKFINPKATGSCGCGNSVSF